MKRLFTLVLLVATLQAQGQIAWGDNIITFDSVGLSDSGIVEIDTSYIHNEWQIGRPQKDIFNRASSLVNAIVTDTLHPYHPGDTSVFYLKPPPVYYIGWIAFKYKLDADTASIIKIEASVDSGHNWFNLLDTMFWGTAWIDTPRFSVFDTAWHENGIRTTSAWSLPINAVYRFTFIGGYDTTKPGWMIDDIDIYYWWEGVPLLRNDHLISIYPNPSHGNLYIHADKPNKDATVIVYNTLGQEVYTAAAPKDNHINLNLPDGMYMLRYSTDVEYCVKQIVISK